MTGGLMLKELLVLFLIALVAGSIWNGMNEPPQPAGGGASTQGSQPTTQYQEVADVGSDTFQGLVLDSKEPVLVEFYTTGCAACQKMAPVLAQLSAENENRFHVYRLNCDKNSTLSDRYYSGPVPAFVLFDNGRLVNQCIGAQSKEELLGWIQNNLGSSHGVPITIPTSTEQQGSLPQG